MMPMRSPTPVFLGLPAQTPLAPIIGTVTAFETRFRLIRWMAFTPGSLARAGSRDASVVTATPAYAACVVYSTLDLVADLPNAPLRRAWLARTRTLWARAALRAAPLPCER